MRKPSLLILSHQGLSFLDDLMEIAHRLGLKAVVLSSRPAPANRSRIPTVRERAAGAHFTRSAELKWTDVRRHLSTLKREGYDVRACVSVWEGYRGLMAQANRAVGAPDLEPESVQCLVDKLALRQRLASAGLSRIGSERANPQRLRDCLAKGELKFLKPRTGLGSFGAFRLTPDVIWETLEAVLREMEADYEYQSLLSGFREFVLEDFIPGVEASFEIVAVDKKLHYLATHEKVEVEQKSRTLLENASACPPLSLSPRVIAAGKRYLEQCFDALGLGTGLFHVEAKYDFDSARWEIIEINPRVGGALIKESVRVVTGGLDLLETWVRGLLARDARERARLSASLSRRVSRRTRRATFFKVFFGEPGRRIRSIETKRIRPEPKIVRVAVKPGARLPESSREIFLGQALWSWSRPLSPRAFESLKRISNETLEVTYEAHA